MLSVVLTLIVVGVLLYLLENYIPLNATIKWCIYVVVAICVGFWLLNVFGVLDYVNAIPVPRIHR